MRTTIALALGLLCGSCTDPLASQCDDPTNTCNHSSTTHQRLGDFRQDLVMYPDGGTNRPVVGTGVDIQNVVVVAIDNYIEGPRGTVGDTWIQERVMDPNFHGCVPVPVALGGGRMCGIQLFSPVTTPAGSHPLIGDLVNVSGGIYEEFNCPTCSAQFPMGRSLPELAMVSMMVVGSTRVPDPIPVTLAEMEAGGDAYTGVLVKITDTVTLGAVTSRGEIPVDGMTNMTNQLTPLVDPATGMPLAAGTMVRNLVGIASYFFSPKIIPRTPQDYEIVH